MYPIKLELANNNHHESSQRKVPKTTNLTSPKSRPFFKFISGWLMPSPDLLVCPWNGVIVDIIDFGPSTGHSPVRSYINIMCVMSVRPGRSLRKHIDMMCYTLIRGRQQLQNYFDSGMCIQKNDQSIQKFKELKKLKKEFTLLNDPQKSDISTYHTNLTRIYQRHRETKTFQFLSEEELSE